MGKNVKLDFTTHSEITIIDFWLQRFALPGIQEMKPI
jgi:hypothetical protein